MSIIRMIMPDGTKRRLDLVPEDVYFDADNPVASAHAAARALDPIPEITRQYAVRLADELDQFKQWRAERMNDALATHPPKTAEWKIKLAVEALPGFVERRAKINDLEATLSKIEEFAGVMHRRLQATRIQADLVRMPFDASGHIRAGGMHFETERESRRPPPATNRPDDEASAKDRKRKRTKAAEIIGRNKEIQGGD